MALLTLKSYQQDALDALSAFLQDTAAAGDASAAFRRATGRPYASQAFGNVPCVCLRIPTGGGKTLVAAHAVGRIARDWQATDAPVAVWLVPSDAIRAQTLAALQSPGHPFRDALESIYGDRLQVIDLDRMDTLAPSDWGRHAIVLVATLQSFRVEETGNRNVYAFSERFEPHFRGLSPAVLAPLQAVPDACVSEADVARAPMLARFLGKPRYSAANWLALQQPMLIVDEAHNARTETSFRTLARLNPSCILELTATPVPSSTNVLHHVSAQQLQAEDMIKMPIVLREHPDGWETAVQAAVQTQNLLEDAARRDRQAGGVYLRPIVLFQAQNAGDAMPPEALRAHLQTELHVAPERIAIATGDVRELDGVDLSSPDCPIRFVITVQALREGWDCPFAYVLCSLQRLSSATAVEQLLGRVLRMPQARRRADPLLNRAYAFVVERDFSSAAHALKDRLIQGMGFEALDVASMMAGAQPGLFGDALDGEAGRPAVPAIETVLELRNAAALPSLPSLPGVRIATTDAGARVTLTGTIDERTAAVLVSAERGARRQEAVARQVAEHNALVASQRAPASRGARFAPVPVMAYRAPQQDALFPLEREAVLEAVGIDLDAQPATLPGFQVVESSNAFELYLDEARVAIRAADAAQLALDAVSMAVTETDLVRWLDANVRQADIPQTQLRGWLVRVVHCLMHDKGVPIAALARMRFVLARKLAERLAELRARIVKDAFRQLVLDGGWQIEADFTHPFHFNPDRYPASAETRYRGAYTFARHFYPVIADLKSGGEEFECAQHIDRHPSVRHWVRNLDQGMDAFSLPTSRQRFHPDFIAELIDGRVAVIEYKGEHLRHNPAEIEKRLVGERWAASSSGRCVFGFVHVEEDGRDIEAQVAALLK